MSTAASTSNPSASNADDIRKDYVAKRLDFSAFCKSIGIDITAKGRVILYLEDLFYRRVSRFMAPNDVVELYNEMLKQIQIWAATPGYANGQLQDGRTEKERSLLIEYVYPLIHRITKEWKDEGFLKSITSKECAIINDLRTKFHQKPDDGKVFPLWNESLEYMCQQVQLPDILSVDDQQCALLWFELVKEFLQREKVDLNSYQRDQIHPLERLAPRMQPSWKDIISTEDDAVTLLQDLELLKFQVHQLGGVLDSAVGRSYVTTTWKHLIVSRYDEAD